MSIELTSNITATTVANIDLFYPFPPLSFVFYGTSGNDTLYGTNFNDSIYCYEGNDVVYAYSGNDYIDGGSGKDYLDGDAGNDYLTGGSGDDTLDGDVGNDTMYGGDGNDRILGWIGNDFLSGGNGNDWMAAQGDSDTLYGGNGNDTLYAGGDNVSDFLSGDGGHDWLHAGPGADTLYGGSGNDTLDGDLGGDVMYGGTGNDIYYVDAQEEFYFDGVVEYAKEGIDTVYTSAYFSGLADNVEKMALIGNAYGANGNDLNNVMIGNSVNNFLWGNAGNDTITGGAGNDILQGYGYSSTAEYDTLTGDVGADKFNLGSIFNSYYLGAGNALITDFKYLEGDTLVMQGNASLYTEADVIFAGVGTGAADTGIYKNGDLIAILQDVSGSNFILNLDTTFIS